MDGRWWGVRVEGGKIGFQAEETAYRRALSWKKKA